jgi:hypothetical protein
MLYAYVEGEPRPRQPLLKGEAHRADVHCTPAGRAATTIELQHSPISEDERDEREAFYTRYGRMFWLLHLHDEQQSMRGVRFRLSVDLRKEADVIGGRQFWKAHWAGPSQFIERWKRSKVHVFFDFAGHLFYLATNKACRDLLRTLKKGEFAFATLTQAEFVRAASGHEP